MGFYGGKAGGLEDRGGAGLPPSWEESGANKFQGEPIFVTAGASCVGQFGSSVKHRPIFIHSISDRILIPIPVLIF